MATVLAKKGSSQAAPVSPGPLAWGNRDRDGIGLAHQRDRKT
jgi:hypothetical protein